MLIGVDFFFVSYDLRTKKRDVMGNRSLQFSQFTHDALYVIIKYDASVNTTKVLSQTKNSIIIKFS